MSAIWTPTHQSLGHRLVEASEAEFDRLPFGVIEMGDDMHVLRYNRVESELSGLAPERVIGRHFFKEVAPCTNNMNVAGRFVGAPMDMIIPYVFAFKLRPVPVTLRLICSPALERNWIIVTH